MNAIAISVLAVSTLTVIGAAIILANPPKRSLDCAPFIAHARGFDQPPTDALGRACPYVYAAGILAVWPHGAVTP